MNYKMIGKFLSQILMIEVIFMIPALLMSFWYHEPTAAIAFAETMAITAIVAFVVRYSCRNVKRIELYAKEGFVCVGLSWIVLGLFGALPFYLSGDIPSYIDSLFEIVSGFTTTGSSILPAVEPLMHGILYWRSASHWIGGMGVLVFLLAIAPASGTSNSFTIHLLRAESPGPEVDKLVPRMKTTASILYKIYIALTVLDFIFLVIGHMPLFDALCTALGTAGTGGFGIKNDSIASYSPYLQYVCTIFMLLFGVNFNCYYLILMKKAKSAFKDEEVRMYWGIVIATTVMIMINIRNYYDTLEEAFRHASFQVATIITTTGFATTDFDLWPTFSKTILVVLMIVGACAGSTGGGMKCGRILLLLKGLHRNLHQMIMPKKIEKVRVNNRAVDEKTLVTVNTYVAAYFLIVFVSFFLISLEQNMSVLTNFTAVLACFNNIGPGLEQVGPTCNFGDYSVFSKLVLIMDMLAGRLEIFPILMLFLRSTWK